MDLELDLEHWATVKKRYGFGCNILSLMPYFCLFLHVFVMLHKILLA